MSKKKKEAWEIVLKDRFLSENKQDNPYVMALLYFVVFFLSFLLVFVCFFQLCLVNGKSMENTLYNGDHVLLLKSSSEYKRGNIVVITKKDEYSNNESNIIKRVIAVEGDSIYYDLNSEDNTIVELYLKKSGEEEFKKLDENYIAEPMSASKFSTSMDGFNGYGEKNAIYIDEGMLYVMGDNRNNSTDSRMDGAYSVTNVYCKSVMIVKKGTLLEKFLKFLYHENNVAND